jgi:hypothetical protein
MVMVMVMVMERSGLKACPGAGTVSRWALDLDIAT